MKTLITDVDAHLHQPKRPSLAGYRAWLRRNLRQTGIVDRFDALKSAVKYQYGCSLSGEREIYEMNGKGVPEGFVRQEGESGSTLIVTAYGFEYVEWADNYVYRMEFSDGMYYAAYKEWEVMQEPLIDIDAQSPQSKKASLVQKLRFWQDATSLDAHSEVFRKSMIRALKESHDASLRD